MPFKLTREQLYDLVWSEALRTLAPKIGVSDVALSKQCRRIDVPIPERGYWNKLLAGQEVSRTPLPPRDLGTTNQLEMKGELNGELLERISNEPGIDRGFDNLEELTDRFRKRLGKVPVPRDFSGASPVISKLLQKDEVIRQKKLTDRFYWHEPKYDTPAQRRRLRIINALLLAFEKVGGSGWIREEREQEEISAHVGQVGVTFRLEYGARKGRGAQDEDAKKKLVLTIQTHRSVVEATTRWEDSVDKPLEGQVTEIVVGMALVGEHLRRQWMAERAEWERQRQEEEAREVRRRQEEFERREREKIVAAEKARLDALIAEATAWNNADLIRRYVAAVRHSTFGYPQAFEDWADWATMEADRLDPIASGRFEESEGGGEKT